MKFTGSRLVITPAESDLVIDSGYDCFSKNTTIVAPKDWCAVIIQNGKHVANGRDTFTLSSIKHSRKTGSGIKFPLFGDLKIKILFICTKISFVAQAKDTKVTIGGKSYSMSLSISYDAKFTSVSAFLKFMKNLDLKPGERGVMMTRTDFSFVIKSVLPQYLKPGSTGYGISARTTQEKAYLAQVEEVFKKKLLVPIGWETTHVFVNYLKIV